MIKMDDRKILREISRMLNVNETDIPRTLERFMAEIEEIEKKLKK